MGRLTLQTQANYRARLKKLRRWLAIAEENHPERPKVIGQIERLTNQLGMEMTDLEAALARGPGRPRMNPQIDDELKAIGTLDKEKPTVLETPEEKEARHRERQAALREKLKAVDPEFIADKDAIAASEATLKEMMDLANAELVAKEVPDDEAKGRRES